MTAHGSLPPNPPANAVAGSHIEAGAALRIDPLPVPPLPDTAWGSRRAPTLVPRAAIRSIRNARRLTDPARRHWTINGDFLALKATGIARYGREMTLAFDRLIDDRHPLTHGLTLDLVAPRQAADPLALQHISMKVVPELRPRLPQVWVQLQLPRGLPGGLLSFCNLAPIGVRKHIVCIHDLQTRTTPESYGRLFRAMHRMILPALGRHADIVTTVSAFSKSTFLDFGLVSPDKVAVVPNGSDHALRWDAGQATMIWRQDRPFVLCIGRNEAHKNMELIWRMAAQLNALSIDIVIAGEFNPLRLDRATGGRPANLRCLGRVGDHDLARGFSEALAFLFPSRTEGFGLPAVEAMVCGCPVIASRTPCLMEICGQAALFAAPDDAVGWIDAIRGLAEQPQLGEVLRQAGRVRACDFAWREAAESYLRLMLQVDQRHAARSGDHETTLPGALARTDRVEPDRHAV